MSTVAFVHTKGGVAKTTSSIYLGAAAHKRGMTVELLDADPQRSAGEWADDAAQAGDPLPFPVRTVTARSLRPTPGVDLSIVDTPPGTASVIAPSLEVADLVVIPTGVSPLDVRRVWPTLEVTAHKPTVVLLTGVALNTTLAAEVRAALDDEGVAVATTPILRREGIRKAYGTAPRWPLYGYDDVLDELMGVLV